MAGTRRLVAIMFTDLVGFTSAAQADEAAALLRLREQEGLVRPVLRAYGGREIKSTGDGFLVAFDSALKAVDCALEIQRLLHERNTRHPEVPLRLCIGVHAGDVEERDGDLFGDAVNVAARIVKVADPEGVCVSQQVADHVRNKTPVTLEPLDPKTLKGVREPLTLYRVRMPWKGSVASADVATPAAAGSQRRLAVLPLANISPEASDEYFADGLTEELITVLSRIRGLGVIARTSVARYKGTPKSVAEIASELGVDSVLEGSVRKAGQRIRITLQLVDAKTQEHVWAESYNRELDDVFAIQSDVAERTAETLKLELLAPAREAIHRGPTRDLRAYDLFLRGVHAATDADTGSLEVASRWFEEATRLDPTFAAAYSYWANTYIAYLGEEIGGKESLPRARELVARALELDPNSSEAHVAAGNLALQGDLDWGRAEAEFRRATGLNPNNAGPRYWYGILLVALQRFDEAKRELERAAEIDPLQKDVVGWLGLAHTIAHEFAAGIAVARRAAELAPPSGLDHVRVGLAFLAAGDREAALKEAELTPRGPGLRARYYRAILLARLGRTEEAKNFLEETTEGTLRGYLSATRRGGLYAVLGETDKALDELERDFREGDRGLWFEYQFATFDTLRSDPRFQALLRAYGLPSAPFDPR